MGTLAFCRLRRVRDDEGLGVFLWGGFSRKGVDCHGAAPLQWLRPYDDSALATMRRPRRGQAPRACPRPKQRAERPQNGMDAQTFVIAKSVATRQSTHPFRRAPLAMTMIWRFATFLWAVVPLLRERKHEASRSSSWRKRKREAFPPSSQASAARQSIGLHLRDVLFALTAQWRCRFRSTGL
jgi:hypothetical protein